MDTVDEGRDQNEAVGTGAVVCCKLHVRTAPNNTHYPRKSRQPELYPIRKTNARYSNVRFSLNPGMPLVSFDRERKRAPPQINADVVTCCS